MRNNSVVKRWATLVVAGAAMMRGAARQELPLMPMPAHVEPHEGALPIDGGFTVAGCGARDPQLHRAMERFAARVSRATGIPMLHPVGTGECAQATLAIESARPWTAPKLGEDESYQLEVTAKGARLKAAGSTGVLRGLATFEQLVQPGASSFEVPAVSIDDRPRFPWRGFMLDASRHWMPIEVVKRNLDGMELVKLNVFHWHLSDDQGFRVESKLFPKLQGEGSDGHYYTQDQIRDVIEYARERGIRVVPEFDIPGHTTSWLVGYPEYASAPGPYPIARGWGVLEATMDPTHEATYRFLDRFIGEMARLFPDPYFHIGGDEVNEKQWSENAAIQSFMRAHSFTTSKQLHGYFNKRIGEILTKHGKRMIGWDEILAPDLDAKAMIQSWRGQESLADAARKGHDGILSFGYYLDHMRPASFHYANDPLSGDAKTLDAEQSKHILGGEACMWTEYANSETVDSRTWPRLAAIAERLWSPAELTDAESMYARMEQVSRKLTWTGVEHRGNEDSMLARIAGGRYDPGLQTLAGAVEALGIRDRYKTRKYTSLLPLNRFVDSISAESEAVRQLESDARGLAARTGDAVAAQRLRLALESWKNLTLLKGEFLNAELADAAGAVNQVARIGLEALTYMDQNQTAPADWVNTQRTAINAAAKPIDELNIAAVRVVRVLVEAAAAPQHTTGAL